MKKRILFCLLSLTAFYSHSVAQVTTVDVNTDKDSYILSSASTTNYGTDTKLYAGVNGSGNIRRSFVHFDLSFASTSIPTNAIITSATLYLKSDGTYSSPLSPLLAERVLADWTETAITASTAPSVSTSGSATIPGLLTTYNYMTADVTSAVQNMVNYPALNFGWRIRLYTETAGHSVGLYSRNYSPTPPLYDPIYAPYVSVSYVLPIVITADEIIHASSSTATDGEIHPTITEGDGTYTYNWIDGATGSSISTSQNLTGVGYGWYGLEVTDGLGNKGYMSFIVGAKCETVEIDYNPGPNYIEDAPVINTIIGTLVNDPNTNFGNSAQIYASKFVSFNGKSLLKFDLWLSDEFKLASSSMTLSGYNHNPGSGSDNNASVLDRVTQDWQENVVTYNTFPTSSTDIEQNIPVTTTTNEDEIVDMNPFFKYWQTNPTNNYGVVLNLAEPTANVTRAMQFYSSDYTTDLSKDPKVVFEVSMECGSYYELKERLDGGFSELQFNKLKFHFVEEYEIQPGKKLPFTIYDKQHNIVASSDENGVTTGGVSALNYEFDNNQYNIDVSGLGLSLNEFYLLEVKCLDGRKYYMNFVIRN